MTRLLILLASLVLMSRAEAEASDQCSDIIKDGTLQTVNIRTNDLLQQVILDRLSRMTYEESQKDKSFDANIAIGPKKLGVGYDEKQFRRYQDDLRRQLDTSLTISQQRDIALASGDPTIINAWSNCMDKKGGLSVRYIINNKNSAFAIVEWRAAPKSGVPEVFLTEDVKLDENIAEDRSDLECLKKGRVLITGTACTAHLYVKSARTPIMLIVKAASKNGSVEDASAYLPPRLRYQVTRKPYFTKMANSNEDFYFEGAKKDGDGDFPLSRTVDPTENGGWRFDPQSIEQSFSTINNVNRGDCIASPPKANSFTSYFSFRVRSNSSGTQVCRMYPRIDLIKEEWVEDGAPAVSSTGPNLNNTLGADKLEQKTESVIKR
ncbi:hypothetical protein [Methylobacterium sp. Leaf87]|uniref:hypothetical protein n=1 Tax=Methylobacterium sp. Leaf87 TaxID=1736243 RepID=UPI000AF9F3C3|nr:hypothetical protein [Methylobacterium sp. Leaf87]